MPGSAAVSDARYAVRAPASAQTARPGDVSVVADYLPNRHDTSSCGRGCSRSRSLDPTPRTLITLSRLRRRSPRAPAESAQLAGTFGRERGRDRFASTRRARVHRRSDSICSPASAASCGDGSTSCSRPTSSIRSTCRGSSSKGAARRGCRSRSSARAALLSEDASLEGVYVPFFRRGRFDQLDEPTSPFNIEVRADVAVCDRRPRLTIERREPPATFGNAQGGARFNATTGRAGLERLRLSRLRAVRARHVEADAAGGCRAD